MYHPTPNEQRTIATIDLLLSLNYSVEMITDLLYHSYLKDNPNTGLTRTDVLDLVRAVKRSLNGEHN